MRREFSAQQKDFSAAWSKNLGLAKERVSIRNRPLKKNITFKASCNKMEIVSFLTLDLYRTFFVGIFFFTMTKEKRFGLNLTSALVHIWIASRSREEISLRNDLCCICLFFCGGERCQGPPEAGFYTRRSFQIFPALPFFSFWLAQVY